MSKIPLVPLALALAGGILIAHLFPTLPLALWLVFVAVVALVVGLLVIFGRDLSRAYIPLLLLFVSIGGLLCSHTQSDPLLWYRNCPRQAVMTLHLKETPAPRERSWKVLAEVERIGNRPAHGNLRLYLRRDSTAPTLHYGDRLLLHGYPDTVSRSLYSTSDHYLVIHRDSTSLRARSEALRMRLLRRMQNGPMPKREGGVAEALTLGWRADIDPVVRDTYRDAGIAHLLAVSGLHVGLLALMAGGLLLWLGRERRGRIIRGSLQLVAVWGFTLLTGLAPSTLRAALMFSLFIVADILGRRTSRLNLLAAAALLTLTIDPMQLFNLSWQLSYAAVAGILLARPVIMAYRNRLWQASMVSIAATLATMPFTLSAFHRLQPYFLIANVIIVPIAGFALGFALLYMALPCEVTAWPATMLLRGMETLSSRVTSLPGAVVEF